MADATGRKIKHSDRLDADAVLSWLAQGQAGPAAAVDLGEECRHGTPGLAGTTLVAEGRVADLRAFPTTKTPEMNQ